MTLSLSLSLFQVENDDGTWLWYLILTHNNVSVTFSYKVVDYVQWFILFLRCQQQSETTDRLLSLVKLGHIVDRLNNWDKVIEIRKHDS